MLIHVECKAFALFIVLWTYYDPVKDRYEVPTVRLRIGDLLYGKGRR